MTDSDTSQMYRTPRLDDVEDVEQYRPSGYHPVNLYDILNSRYKVVHKLGHGGFATIWLARDLKEKRYVALKILMANAPNNDLKFLTYLRDSGSNHPNIASVQNSFVIHGPNGLHQCLVLEFAGPSLRRMADGQHRLSGLMVRNAARQIAEGVAHLHSVGICHGDLTNANILFKMRNIDAWSEAEVYQHLGQPRTASVRPLSGAVPGAYAPVKVVESIRYSDFGESYLTGSVLITDFGESFFTNDPPTEFLGTPAPYFAPEMLFGRAPSPASDVWALGCLIFELRASRPLICVFFGRVDEGLAEVIQTLGPLPKAWQHSYHDKTIQAEFRPGQDDPWFDPSDMRHPLESLVSEVMPKLTAEERASFISLLRGALELEVEANHLH